jgi:hypothetical protein
LLFRVHGPHPFTSDGRPLPHVDHWHHLGMMSTTHGLGDTISHFRGNMWGPWSSIFGRYGNLKCDFWLNGLLFVVTSLTCQLLNCSSCPGFGFCHHCSMMYMEECASAQCAPAKDWGRAAHVVCLPYTVCTAHPQFCP